MVKWNLNIVNDKETVGKTGYMITVMISDYKSVIVKSIGKSRNLHRKNPEKDIGKKLRR